MRISLRLLRLSFPFRPLSSGLLCLILLYGGRINYVIKVSLDGFANVHNSIRGANAYENVIKSIEAIHKHENVALYISTVINEG